MTKRLRVIAIVVFILVICTGTASAFDGELKTVTVVDSGTKVAYRTLANTTEEFLESQKIEINEGDILNPSLSHILVNNDTVTIKRAFPVTLSLDGVPKMILTTKDTVGELLKSLDASLSSDFELKDVTLNTKLSENTIVELVSSREKTVTTTEKIPFKVQYRDSNAIAYGTERIVQNGSEGELEVVRKEIYKGDTLVKTTEVSKKVVKEPVDSIVEKGTAVMVATPVGDFKYKKSITVEATGYTQYDEGCNNTTATGAEAKHGVIAVDPRVIPLGTKVYIPGYGMASAQDTGGAIKGNKIDLCYSSQSEAFSWGRRSVTIYILD